jgi:hypothetical protein
MTTLAAVTFTAQLRAVPGQARPVPDPMKVVPYGFDMGTTEDIVMGFDTTNLLISPQMPSSPVVSIKEVVSGDVISTAGITLTIQGNVIIANSVAGSLFTAGLCYFMLMTFSADANNTLSMLQLINCER